MGQYKMESGFTIVEMVVTLIVMSIFLTVFLQLYSVNESQRGDIVRNASANDIAMTNLEKITSKATISSLYPCSSANDPTTNPAATGSIIASNQSGDSPQWGSGNASAMNSEPLTGTSLPSTTTQKLTVLYPEGCTDPNMPAKIVSTVTYGTSETVTHAAYVN